MGIFDRFNTFGQVGQTPQAGNPGAAASPMPRQMPNAAQPRAMSRPLPSPMPSGIDQRGPVRQASAMMPRQANMRGLPRAQGGPQTAMAPRMPDFGGMFSGFGRQSQQAPQQQGGNQLFAAIMQMLMSRQGQQGQPQAAMPAKGAAPVPKPGLAPNLPAPELSLTGPSGPMESRYRTPASNFVAEPTAGPATPIAPPPASAAPMPQPAPPSTAPPPNQAGPAPFPGGIDGRPPGQTAPPVPPDPYAYLPQYYRDNAGAMDKVKSMAPYKGVDLSGKRPVEMDADRMLTQLLSNDPRYSNWIGQNSNQFQYWANDDLNKVKHKWQDQNPGFDWSNPTPEVYPYVASKFDKFLLGK